MSRNKCQFNELANVWVHFEASQKYKTILKGAAIAHLVELDDPYADRLPGLQVTPVTLSLLSRLLYTVLLN